MGYKKEKQVIQANKMKVQVLDRMEDSTQLERDMFHFLMSLPQEINYAQRLLLFLTSSKEEIRMLVKSFCF